MAPPCFVAAGAPLLTTSFVRPSVCSSRQARVARPATRVRMGLGEDGLAEDIAVARDCIEDGCSVDAVQDVLTRLEERRAVLSLEVTQIKEVMETLARANIGGDRNLVADAVEAALGIFAKTDDNYPMTGDAMGYTGEKPKRKQAKM